MILCYNRTMTDKEKMIGAISAFCELEKMSFIEMYEESKKIYETDKDYKRVIIRLIANQLNVPVSFPEVVNGRIPIPVTRKDCENLSAH